MCKNILNEIEYCREKMVQLTTTMPLSSEEVVAVSSKLDYLLNEYEKTKTK
ncbi:aspartyl-phosphate phosphatase Spo0E family protein [Pontibacillus sp. HMF3514]|uniref:aspartyl-phosphate phosphatase Spo0E family protein n=1 Tax=Pontibacillus sp. HMF3514 TaxID=2692425 RepID=UPI00131F7FC5|nr:aspartyl-phosphate phosphatase Spo0E family protein [Pontibacillus sp. HMF3514]QHE50732.1 Spo0E family sporulation regulatory protein-aspartic acid phosphatase [Pontibacillus sp. HMF3514]